MHGAYPASQVGLIGQGGARRSVEVPRVCAVPGKVRRVRYGFPDLFWRNQVLRAGAACSEAWVVLAN
jgi:hypothetical protein